MSESLIQMYATATSSQDDMASIDVPEDGDLMGVVMSIRNPNMTAATHSTAELSFLSSSQFTTNDARGLIAGVTIALAALNTNGLSASSNTQEYIFHKGLSVNAGERIHLHLLTTDTTAVVITAHMIFKFKGGVRAIRRR